MYWKYTVHREKLGLEFSEEFACRMSEVFCKSIIGVPIQRTYKRNKSYVANPTLYSRLTIPRFLSHDDSIRCNGNSNAAIYFESGTCNCDSDVE